ncbi:unnamed protein product, partial [Discosporangium mesarthrocarpum]
MRCATRSFICLALQPYWKRWVAAVHTQAPEEKSPCPPLLPGAPPATAVAAAGSLDGDIGQREGFPTTGEAPVQSESTACLGRTPPSPVLGNPGPGPVPAPGGQEERLG